MPNVQHITKAKEVPHLFVLVKEALHRFVLAKEAPHLFTKAKGALDLFNRGKGAPHRIDLTRPLHLAVWILKEIY